MDGQRRKLPQTVREKEKIYLMTLSIASILYCWCQMSGFDYGAFLECLYPEKTEEFLENPVSVPPCPPRIPH